MSAELTARDLVEEMRLIADRLAESRDELCRLDGVIGDGDHGVAMADGFAAAAKAASLLDPESATLADVLNSSAKALLNAVGASSGPLYATALMRAAKSAGARRAIPLVEAPAIIVAMAEGVKTRGQATIGDKTMLDAWGKAANVAQQGLVEGAALTQTLDRLRIAAHEGAESTKAMTASKGRAARLGERSLGHIDPGAASAALIIDVLVADWLRLSGGKA
jgi:phosphoenolpyruvate---glycerone phosphotransferase subunit DhaL